MAVKGDPRDQHGPPVNRVAVVLYCGGAVLLAPWIVVLYLSQKPVADAYHLKLTSMGLSVITVIALLSAASAIRKRAPIAVLWIATAATYLFMSAFFDTITANHRPLLVAGIYDFWVKTPMIVLSIWFALKVSGGRGSFNAAPVWFRRVCLVAVVVLIPLFITVASVSPRTQQLHNLRIFWSGLDVFELIGMALTGWCLVRRSPHVVGAATITGTLLISDAWFNIITTVGKSHRAALAMAFVEVPAAIYSFAIARREISSWSVGHSDPVAVVSPG
jgi:hypothetical protein